MAIVVGENSFVTIAEADTYFTERYGYDQWASLDDAVKEQLLVSAYNQMYYMCKWYDDIRELDPIPDDIKAAQCEIAYGMLSAGGTQSDPADVLTKLKAGDVELEFAGKTQPTGGIVNDYAKSLLSQYGMCSFGTGTKVIPIARS